MRHKKRKKSSGRRRSRRGVGAVDVKKIGVRVAGIAAGAFACRTINNMVVKSMPSLSQTMIGLGDALVGLVIPKFLKNEIGQGIGDAFVTIGALTTMQSLGAITGVGAVPRSVPTRVIGAGSRPFLSNMVGATNRPYMRQTVGGGRMGSAYSQMERMNRQAQGVAHSMGALALEE
jgi:hypothetical protein